MFLGTDYNYNVIGCFSIPISVGGKLVLTWRSMDIPDEMSSCLRVSVTVYTGWEYWILFQEKLKSLFSWNVHILLTPFAVMFILIISIHLRCGSKRKLIGTFCGNIKPFTIYTRSGGCLKILYFDNNISSNGSSWSLEYKFMKDTETLNNYGSWCLWVFSLLSMQ